MNRQAVSAIIFRNNKKELLLIKRRDIPVWVLPGGGIEPNETPEQAAVREVKEETGLEVSIKRKIAKYYPLNRLTQITHFFECDIVSGNLLVGSETKELQFFSKNQLPKYLAPPFQHWIEDALLDQTEVMEKKISSVTYKRMFQLLVMHPILVCRFLLTKIGIHINH
jgi:8-oxo-dGTP pyrophosphatase MutT (NUDIX family)